MNYSLYLKTPEKHSILLIERQPADVIMLRIKNLITEEFFSHIGTIDRKSFPLFMQKPFFQITAETKLIDEDFVTIEAYQQPFMYEFSYFVGGKVYYAINTEEIIGFDLKNLCIFFKNDRTLYLYEEWKTYKIKAQNIMERLALQFGIYN